MSKKAKRPETLIAKFEAMQKIGYEVEVPWQYGRFLGTKRLSIWADQVEIANDADFGDLDDIQASVEWLVNQLGGSVKWMS